MAGKKKGELSNSEKELFESIESGNIELVRQLLGSPDVSVNCIDEHGMTPLQHAAFKGKVPLCELMLANGAAVNINEHENGYTTLMFGALSGNKDVTRLMLQSGAKTSPVNSVGRTASQMAAFVGQHDCVSIINNFFSREDVDYFTKPQGFEKEPKLKPELAGTFHKLILQTNLNPVKLVLFVKKHGDLLNESVAVARVFDCICEKQMKSSETNEVLAMKMHYLASLLRMCHTWDVQRPEGVDGLLKVLLKGQEPDGEKIAMEKMIRQWIRDFPYHESELLQQIVRNLANVTIGDDPTALMILTQGINGSRSVETEDVCSTCGDAKAAKKCSACKMVNYCNPDCQKLHWFTHKKICKNLAADFLRLQKLNQELEEEGKRKKEEEEKSKDAETASSEGKPEDAVNTTASMSDITLEDEASQQTETATNGQAQDTVAQES